MTAVAALVFAAAGLLSSCRATRGTVATTDTPSTTVTDVSRPPASSLTDNSTADAYGRLTSGYSSWQAVEVPFKVNISSPAKLSASGRMYMTRGKDIYLSVRVLGMEVANMYITADSVFASEKLNKRYVAEPLKRVLANANLSINDIQDVLLGRAFIPGVGTLDASMAAQLQLSTANGMLLILPSRQPKDYEIGFLADTAEQSLTTLVVEPAGRKPIECAYSAPVNAKGIGRVCNDISITTNAAGTAISASIQWRYNEAKTSGVNSSRWKMPKGYTRVQAAQLIKLLKF